MSEARLADQAAEHGVNNVVNDAQKARLAAQTSITPSWNVYARKKCIDQPQYRG